MSKRILITGAARGIGADSARRLAARGHRLALVGLEGEQLRAVAEACGPQASAHEADVTDRAALRAAVDASVERHGGLDAAVVNAGIASGAFARSVDPDEWERIIRVNLLGSFETVHACLPHLVASRGYLLQVASVAAVAHAPLMSAYCASKAGVEAMANSLRTELAHHGVDVGTAYFSWIDTDMVRGSDAMPPFRHLRAHLRWPFNHTSPLAHASEAVVRGVETRARLVAHPKWVRWLLPVRGLVQPVAGLQSRPLMPEAERLWEQEIAARGAVAASAPVGAGGEAAAHSEVAAG